MIATPRHTRRRTAAFLLLPLALAACSGNDDDQDLGALDNQLIGQGNGVDPAITGALRDQIMVDPDLVGQSNGGAIRPPSQPYSAGVPKTGTARRAAADGKLMRAPAPVKAKACSECEAGRESLTIGALAANQPAAKGCAADLDYSAKWAQRLPDGLALYPRAHVIEAAGSTGGRCHLRVVSFWADQPMQHMLDWYYTQARRAGYDAEHQVDGNEHILGGTRTSDGGAYVLFMTPRKGGGTDIDLVANRGV
ncbi:hypothetical protein [Stakelama saccharophila]|uniref:Lipoprotein n=1 Tax=Stakelama saccharophila TaxID=3075605 RepID=A0ABZ0BAV4_9SPHN|nr:hypothetical protein [Stakelama sp. W311]WNO54546.1 hypothetical protein RPR59_04635 [Stakelama sp. W311]